MSLNDNKNKKNFQKNLIIQRKRWEDDKKSLEKQKNSLGFKEIPLKKFFNTTFIEGAIQNVPDSETTSAIIAIHNKLKILKDQYQLLWPEEYVIHKLNKKHAVLHIEQTYIMTEKKDALGQDDFSLEKHPSFKNFYANEVIQCTDGKIRKIATIWLTKPTHPKCRKYTNLIFNPTHAGHIGTEYNLWDGFTRKQRKGSPLKYWAHVKKNICSDNEEHYKYLRKWLAYIFQHPDKVHTALVLCGSQGVGKNSFVEPLGILFGRHYTLLSNISELLSNFNNHLKYAVLIHANEALWGGNKKEIGTIKAMITEQRCLIESKGKDRVMFKNFKHLILSSNEDWPVHIDADDRRFFVLRVSEAHKEDHPYFAQIQAELNNNGYEGLLYDLLNEDLSNFNPRRLPYSRDSFFIKLRSADSASRYIYDALQEGSFDLEGENIWHNQLPRDEMYRYYSNWCIFNNEQKIGNSRFGLTINKLIRSIKNSRPTINGRRTYAYQIASLEEAKKDFCKAFKADVSHSFNQAGADDE